MYLRKIDGPRSVTLPDGSIMTRADLPPAEQQHAAADQDAFDQNDREIAHPTALVRSRSRLRIQIARFKRPAKLTHRR